MSRKRRKRIAKLLFLLSAVAAAEGCGIYTFSGSLPRYLHTVAIPLFDDRTSEFGIKEDLTDALVEQFTRDNILTVTKDERSADSILHGTILRVEDRPGQFDAEERVREIRVYITCQVRFEDRVKRRVLWEGVVSQWGAYDPDTEGPQGRVQALREALRKLAEDIVNKIVSTW
ncbi:MAG: LPS assembly lipoprotein LptE [candidate division KSB1 bacterium]|nr:LPS assembly lipoprotein LptE [candidate division KSB1 bacterium]